MEAAFVRRLRDSVRGRSNQRFKENFRGLRSAAARRVAAIRLYNKLRKQLAFPGEARSASARWEQVEASEPRVYTDRSARRAATPRFRPEFINGGRASYFN